MILKSDQLDLFNLSRLEAALKLELNGMKGRQSLVNVCRSGGFKGGTKKKALAWVQEQKALLKESMKQKHLI
ncbi:MAG TPA: hypothetical protein DEP37_01370 [Algoriphagus sp.]|nr:hypothetical protein [Algoriphagus sp.]|tara:strand:+ start:695 stop:910 length:216 start_codon:yes stop_codon:yes gene_type:complete